MKSQERKLAGASSLLSLVGILCIGSVAYFAVSPGTVVADIPEITIPLGILFALTVVTYKLPLLGYGKSEIRQIAQFGWMGALGAGSIGVWWAGRKLSSELPISSISDEMLTLLSLGIGAGMLAGQIKLSSSRHDSPLQSAHGQLVAESTWTNRPGPDAILVEIVNQLAELEGVHPLELEPLSAHIEPDVFTQLVENQSYWQIRFQVDNYEVLVSSHGAVTIYDIGHQSDEPTAVSETRTRT